MRKIIISFLIVFFMLFAFLPQELFLINASAHEIVMTADEFIACLKTAMSRKNVYNNTIGYNLGYYNGSEISWDCWNLGKSIIWTKGSIVNNYTVGHQASVDTRCGLGDWTGIQIMENTPNSNSDFSNLIPGEWLYLPNNGGHVGYYIGDGQVIECTTSWGVNGITYSQIDNNGTRSKDGKVEYNWLYHGMVPWLDYTTSVDAKRLTKQTYPSHCTIIVTKDDKNIMSLPCSNGTDSKSDKVESAPKGTQYEAIGLILNTENNLWYKVKAKNGKYGYIFAGNVAYSSQIISDIVGSDFSVPTNHIVGNTYPLTGTISSAYNTISNVAAYVYVGSNSYTSQITGGTEAISNNYYSFRGNSVDYQTEFNKLSVGTYTYAVYVSYKNYYAESDKTYSANTGRILLYSAAFNVVNSGSVTPTPTPQEPTGILYPNNGIYKIASGVGNNMYLDFACTNDNVQIYENCDNHSDPAFVISQYYKITHVGDGWHSIINIGNGKAMDVDGGNSASGTNIHQWAYDGNNAQLFRFYDAGDGYCYIKSKLGCYVDVQNGDSVNNTNVWTYSFNGSNAQKWNLIKHLHYYTAEITTPATCSSNGIRTYTCRQCKHSHDETIYATDHSYSSSITKQPTCTKEGVRTFTCSACGHSYTEAIAKKAHSWNAATCTAPKTCSSCGTTEGSALGHNFVSEIITEATCTTVGVEQKTCTRCGELEIYYIDSPGHKYSSVVTPPTCTEYGYTTYTCLNCGDSYTWEREFPAHTIVNGSCSVCGESTVYSSGSCGKNLTWILDFQGTLTISGEGDMLDFRGMGSIPPWEMNSNLIKAIIVEDGITSIGEKAFFSFYPELSSITMADSVTDIGASAFYGNKALDKVVLGKNVKSVGDYAFFSCTALTSVSISNSIANIGESVFSGCSSLTDVYYSGTEEEWDNIAFGNDNEELLNANIHYNCHITPDDHDYVAVVTAPTCTEQGFTTYSCICGSAYITDMVREKGHDYKEVIIYPTCTTDGNVNYVCNACGERLPGNKMPALGHKYFDTVTTVPTCIEVGIRTYTCSRCDSNYSETIPFVGHTFGAAATCTTDQVCTVCGEVLTEKLGHDYNAVVTAPTCTEDGYTTYTCLVCGNGYSGDFVDAEGHSYSSEVTTAPTCTTDGVKTFTCSKCSNSYTESIPATGHKWTAATCTTAKTCSVCKTSVGTALGHNYTSKVTKAATCTAAGVKTFTCSKCSNSYTESIPATGHTWTAATCTTAKTCSVCKATDGAALGHSYTAKVTKAATCTAAGIKTFICENDANHTYTENIPALGHTEEVIPAIAATCTETGLTEGKKCSVCGEVLVAQAVIDKTSHKPTMVGEKAATATQDGYTGDTVCATCGMMIEEGKVIPATGDSSGSGRCDHLCHKDGILGFFWKILRLFFKLFQINPVCECGAAHY